MAETETIVEEVPEEVGIDTTTEDPVVEGVPEEGAPTEGDPNAETDPEGGGAEVEEAPEFTYAAFDEAEVDTVFKDAAGNEFRKVEGCEIPVPVIPKDDEMYSFLHSHGFDQNVINEEFWTNNGELSEDTLAGLAEIFGKGPVESYMSNVRAAHLAYLDGAKSESEAAARQAEQAAQERTARDTMLYSTAGKVFGTEDPEESKAAMMDIITYANESMTKDRRIELKQVLDTGSTFMVNTVLKSIKREMEFNSGDVHKLVSIDGNQSTVDDVVPTGGDEGLPDVPMSISENDLHKYMNDSRGPYWTNLAFREKVDAARLRAIRTARGKRQ